MKVFLVIICLFLCAFCGMAARELWEAGFRFAAMAVWPVGVIATAVTVDFRRRH